LSLCQAHNAVCAKYLRNASLLDILFKKEVMVILNNDRRSNTMEVLVPIVIFGTGIIIATVLAGLGIQRIVEGEKGNK
jgi:hypothetical protein